MSTDARTDHVSPTVDARPAAAPRRSLKDALRLGFGCVRAALVLSAHRVEHGARPCFDGRRPLISNRGRMRVGERLSTRGRQVAPSFATGVHGTLTLGSAVFVNQGAVLHAETAVSIGSHVHIGDGVSVCDTDFHEVDPGLGVRIAPIVIGDGVWLARNVIVLPGARIGEGTVVAAGSVVRGELPAWVVAAGSPARPVRDITTRGLRR